MNANPISTGGHPMYKTLPLILLFLFSIFFFDNKTEETKSIKKINSQFDRLEKELNRVKTGNYSYKRYKNAYKND